MNLNSEDRDNVIRTVIGEVDPNDPDEGRAAVAHVILNRVASGRFGPNASSVVHQRGQFEPWMTRARQLNAIKPDDPEYQRVAAIVDGAAGGKIPDPTGGATHFLDRGVTDRRAGGIDKLAPWANKSPMLAQIGGHSFYAPEGTAHAADSDLLDLYTKPPAPTKAAPAAPKTAQTVSDDDLLKAYSAPATAAPPIAAPQMIGNRPVDPAEVTPGATPAAPAADAQPSLLHRIHSAMDLSGPVARHTGEAFEASKQLALSGNEDYKAGNPYPSFPSTDPKTWGAGGLVKTAAGALGMATSPITGMAQTFVGDPVTQATGNSDVGDRAALVASLPVGGGAAVGGGKAVMAGGKLAATTAVNTARKLSAPTNAIDKIVEMVGPENVPAAVERLKNNPRLNIMDVSDPVRVAGQGLIDPSQSEAHQILATSAKDRAASAAAANNAAYSSTLGPVPDVKQTVADLKKTAQKVGSELINPVVAAAPPVDITSLIQHIDKQIGPRVLKAVQEGRDPGVPLTDAQRDFLEVRERLRGNMPDTPKSSKTVSSKMFMDADQLHEIQSQLRYEGSTLMKAGGSDALKGGRLMDVRQRAVEALDKVSGEIPVPAGHTRYYRLPDSFSGSHDTAWFTTDAAKGQKLGDGKYLDVADTDTATQAKFFGGSGGKDFRVTKDPEVAQSVKPLMGNYKASLAKYRDANNVREAFEDGLLTLKNREGLKGLEDRPEYLADWMKHATPEEIAAKRLGTRVAIDQKINSVRGAAKTASDIPDIEFNRQKLAHLFGEQETDRLFGLMKDAHDEATTNSKIIGGSKTAETIAGQKSLQPREVEPLSLKHNPVGVAGLLATAGTLHGGLIEGGALGAGLLAANVAGAVGKRAYQGVARRMDLRRNVEFSKLATATGGANNPAVAALQGHRSQSSLPSPPSSPTTGGMPVPTPPSTPPMSGGPAISRRAAMVGAVALGGKTGKVAATPKAAAGKLASATTKTAGAIDHFVNKTISHYVKEGLFEDRMEYGIEDLMKSEEIDRKTAEILQREIHSGDEHYKPFD